jgi:hypothetical protein
LPNRSAVLQSLLSEHPDVTMIVHPSWYIDSTGTRLGLWRCPLPQTGRILNSETVIESLLVQNYIAMPAPLVRRQAVMQVGGLDEKLWYTADWDLWLKLACFGQTLYCPKPLACFRLHPFSQSLRRDSEAPDYRNQMQYVLERHLKDWRAPRRRKNVVRRVACFSIEVNSALAAWFHGQKPNFTRLVIDFLTLGPNGWYRYLRDSRIAERVRSRRRLRLTDSSQG